MQAMQWDGRHDGNPPSSSQSSSRRESCQQPMSSQGWTGHPHMAGAMSSMDQPQSPFSGNPPQGHHQLQAQAFDGAIDPSNLTSASAAANQDILWPPGYPGSSVYHITNEPHHFRPHMQATPLHRSHEGYVAQPFRPDLAQHVPGPNSYRPPIPQELSPRSKQGYLSYDSSWPAFPRQSGFPSAFQSAVTSSFESPPMAMSPMQFRRSWAVASSPIPESQSYDHQLGSSLHISGIPSMAPPTDAGAPSSALRARHSMSSSSLHDDSVAHSRSLHLGHTATGSEDLSSIPELVDRRRSSGSLSDQYMATDGHRAQEILKMLRSRAPDSKEGVAACDYCRKRRIKCDREKPTCGRCALAGRVCTTSDTLRKRGPPSKKEREFLAAQGIQFVPSRVRRRSAAMEKAEEQASASILSSSSTGLGHGEDASGGTRSGPTSGLTSPELSPSRNAQVGPHRPQPSSSGPAARRQRADTVTGSIFFEYPPRPLRRQSHDGDGEVMLRLSNAKQARSREDAHAFAQLMLNQQHTQPSQSSTSSSGMTSDMTNQQAGPSSQATIGIKSEVEDQSRVGPQPSPTALVLNQYGTLDGMDPTSFPSTVSELVRTSKKGEDYWASMEMSSADVPSILAFSERLLRHEASRYLVSSYFKNYHNRFPFAYEPWIWQAMETAQRGSGFAGRTPSTKLAAGTQALLLSIIAMSSCTAEPWQVNDGQSANLWWFGYAAHRACMAIVDPPFLHNKGLATWTRYTDSFLSPDLAQSFILVGGYLMNESPEAVWRSIQLGWCICTRQNFHRSRVDPLQSGSMGQVTPTEICKEQGIRTVWALMKLSVTIYLTGRIKTWPRFLVEFDADLPSALHDPSDPEHQELHLNPEALESWSSAMPINRLLLQILTSPLTPEWAQHQQQQAAVSAPLPSLSLDDKRRLLQDFDAQIAQWKQDAECFKAHRAMPLTRSGDEDYAWCSVNSKTRIILRIAEERLSEAHQSIIAEADRTGQPVSDEERKVALRRGIAAETDVNSTGGGHSGLPVTDRVSAWFQTVEDDNVAWYCGTVPAGSSSSKAQQQ